MSAVALEHIQNNPSPLGFNIGSVFHVLNEKHYKYCVRKWYKFENHRWQIITNEQIQTDIMVDVRKFIDKMLDPKLKLYLSYRTALADVAIINSAVRVCQILYKNDLFESVLNSNPTLLCFENGVYDFDIKRLRPGVPEDMISFSTKNSYREYESDSPEIIELTKFFDQIQPNTLKQNKMLSIFADCLNGSENAAESKNLMLNFFVGSNCGKSTLFNLVNLGFGDYCGYLSSLELKKFDNDDDSSDYDSDDSDCDSDDDDINSKYIYNDKYYSDLVKGKRVMIMSEIQDDVINSERLRKLLQKKYVCSNNVMTKSQFKLFAQCNKFPTLEDIYSDDDLWSNIQIMKFESQFVDKPYRKNELKCDPQMYEKLKKLSEAFIWILLQINNTGPLLTHADFMKETNDERLQYEKNPIKNSNLEADKEKVLEKKSNIKKYICVCTNRYGGCAIREKPNLNAKSIGTVIADDIIEVDDDVDGFYKLAGKEAWVVKHFTKAQIGEIYWSEVDANNVIIPFSNSKLKVQKEVEIEDKPMPKVILNKEASAQNLEIDTIHEKIVALEDDNLELFFNNDKMKSSLIKLVQKNHNFDNSIQSMFATTQRLETRVSDLESALKTCQTVNSDLIKKNMDINKFHTRAILESNENIYTLEAKITELELKLEKFAELEQKIENMTNEIEKQKNGWVMCD
jgi:hypothetical protein